MSELRRYALECPPNCSLVNAHAVSDYLASGYSLREVVALAAKLERPVITNANTLGRHKRKHMRFLDEMELVEENPPTNIEILEEIVRRGFANRRNWKPTITDTMKAMDMWYRLTQGNPFDELMNTLADAALKEEPDESKE